MAAPPEDELTWTLESSHRLTTQVSLHTFAKSGHSGSSNTILPSQKVTLQFPTDLDPISGSHNLTEQERRLDFTPCHLDHDSSGNITSFSFLSGNGRVTGLIGLPRPQGQLSALLVGSGGGFPEECLSQDEPTTCIAGGTGIAPFLALLPKQYWKTGSGHGWSLVCSIRGEDFPIIEFLLNKQMLRPRDWSLIQIHVTSGEEVNATPAGKPGSWWKSRFENIRQQFPGSLQFSLGRMTADHLGSCLTEESAKILFCGSKSLEWQIKMWSLGKASVHCTER